jgi:tetratricopeptide (TPR) repeat protein
MQAPIASRYLATFAFSLTTILATFLTTFQATSQTVTLPRPSPAATASQTVGISTVTVKYSRPAVKGRKVWGQLVPFGWNVQGFGLGNSAPWRAGANENTVLHLADAATIEGHAVPAGDYGLFFVINEDNTGEVILSKQSRNWGSFFYDPKYDEMRAKIAVKPAAESTEWLTYDFSNVTQNSAELDLNWEKMQFPVKIEFDVTKIVIANAAQELQGTTGFNWTGYSSAANYVLATKSTENYEQALKWADHAINMTPTFTDISVKAGLLKALGRAAEAETIMKDAVVIGTENELNAYGYQLINDKEQDHAIEVFVTNTQRHPKSANCFDSLGEAYALKGDNKNAIINFKKSLALNPPAATKANSEKYLKQLGAM